MGFYISLFLNVITITILVFLTNHYSLVDKILNRVENVISNDSEPLYLLNHQYLVQLSKYDVYETKQSDVVMLGDSITYSVNWEELMGRKGIVNRGIGGDITLGFVERLDYVYKLNPNKVFIMGGINDIEKGLDVQTIFKNYKHIIDELDSRKIVPIIQSTLFVSPKEKDYKDKNKKVRELNQLLKDYAIQKNIIFVDLNIPLAPNGVLLYNYTYDGIHLNGYGYKIWRDEIKNIIN
ncbi:GDSL-type esterase/lipase family protein [Mesobacillus sp. LC4]